MLVCGGLASLFAWRVILPDTATDQIMMPYTSHIVILLLLLSVGIELSREPT
jgi:hypothetical protein